MGILKLKVLKLLLFIWLKNPIFFMLKRVILLTADRFHFSRKLLVFFYRDLHIMIDYIIGYYLYD